MSDEAGVATVLDDRPDLEDPLEAVLAVDERNDRWDFDDVPIESGPFGELVSRGVVESAGTKYRLADAEAVREALATDTEEEAATTTGAPTLAPTTISPSLPAVDGTTLLFAVAAVAFVGLIRALPVRSIYRDGTVVLSGNDPYYYRYLVEQAVTEGGTSGTAQTGEPLLVATLAALSDLFGGTATTASHVLAWYPVVAALLGAVVVYLLAVAVTEDRRIALAAVLFVAVIPGHAMRTSVGYADHHAFDYLWLGLAALAATKLATVDRETLRETRTWLLTAAVGLAVAAQVLAWDAGPLLLLPVAVLVPARATIDVHRGNSPIPAGVPLVAGLGLGALIALFVSLATGMQSTVVVLSPAVLAAWAGVTLVVAIGGHRSGWSVTGVLAGFALLAVAGLVVLAIGPAPIRQEVLARAADLFRGGAISETQSLLHLDSLGFLFQFGFALVIALPTMVAGVGRSVTDGRWLVLTTYAWFFLALSVLQVRFVGELATFVAVFAGCSFVLVATRLDGVPFASGIESDRTRLRVPNRRVVATLGVLFVLLGGFGAVQASELTDRIVVEDRIYETATVLADRADERGQAYPENYVLSDWSDNRVYNYVVSGESASYLYAQENYTAFAGGTDPDSWYEQFEGRVGYVVLAPARDGVDQRSAIWRLTRNYGSADDGVPGVAHYRALYVPPDGGRVVVEVVPGANLTGSAEPGSTVTVSTDVDRPTLDFGYERRTQAGEDGTWDVRLANPGTYDVTAGNESTSVDVPESAVLDGDGVSAD